MGLLIHGLIHAVNVFNVLMSLMIILEYLFICILHYKQISLSFLFCFVFCLYACMTYFYLRPPNGKPIEVASERVNAPALLAAICADRLGFARYPLLFIT